MTPAIAALHIETQHEEKGIRIRQYFGDYEVPVMTTFLQTQQGFEAARQVLQTLLCVLEELDQVPLLGAEADLGLIRSQGVFELVWLPMHRPVNLNRALIPGQDNEMVRGAVICLRQMVRLSFPTLEDIA